MDLKDFKLHIRQSIADENLQLALDNNAWRRQSGRLEAFASLPDHPELRLQEGMQPENRTSCPNESRQVRPPLSHPIRQQP